MTKERMDGENFLLLNSFGLFIVFDPFEICSFYKILIEYIHGGAVDGVIRYSITKIRTL